MRLLANIFVVAVVSVIATNATAQLLDHGSFMGYGLGKGILGNDYGQPLASCITGTQSTLPASASKLQATIAYDAEQYREAMHIDVKAEASILDFAGGNIAASSRRDFDSSNAAFHVIVEAYSQYPTQTLGNVVWDEPYKSHMASGDAARIRSVRATCGDRFIQTVFNEVRLFAILEFSAQQFSQSTVQTGQAGGNATIDIVKVSGSIGGEQRISQARQSGHIRLRVESQGLGGLVATPDLLRITDSDGLVPIANKLAQYLSSLNATGQPVKYQLAPLPGFSTSALLDQNIEDRLADLKTEYGVARARRDNVDTLLKPQDPRHGLLTSSSVAALRQHKGALNQWLGALASLHDKCRRADRFSEGCADSTPVPPPPILAELPSVNVPALGPYFFVVDGRSVSLVTPGAGKTLFAAARDVDPAAMNVDLFAPISTPYISNVHFSSQNPGYNTPPVNVGGFALSGGFFTLPDYFDAKLGPLDATGVVILHADAQNPCPFRMSADGVSVPEDSCFTAVGRALKQIPLANLANHVSMVPNSANTMNYSGPVEGQITDCFGASRPSLLAQYRVDVDTINGATRSGRAFLYAPLSAYSIILLDHRETFDLTEWKNVAARRAQFRTPAPPAGLCGKR